MTVAEFHPQLQRDWEKQALKRLARNGGKFTHFGEGLGETILEDVALGMVKRGIVESRETGYRLPLWRRVWRKAPHLLWLLIPVAIAALFW